MMLDIYILGPRMELRIFGQCHSPLVVAIDHHRLSGLVPGIELVEKITQSNRFFDGLRLTDVLGFTG